MLQPELCVFRHGLERILWLVLLRREELQDDLISAEKFFIVHLLLFGHVLVELPQFPELVLVMLDLPVEVKPRPFLFKSALLFLS